MQLTKDKQQIFKIFSICLLLVYIIFNFPFLKNFNPSINLKELFKEDDSLATPLLRSIFLGLSQALLLTVLSFVLSLFLFKIKLKSKSGIWLSFLLIPMILGSTSTAFIYKIILFNSSLLYSDEESKFFLFSVIQYWQFGSLFVYLFWINQQFISTSVLDFATASKLNFFEKIKDIILPKQINLFLLLFMVGFIFSIFENAKISFLFKASRGTNTEIINQWLNRNYQSDSLLNIEKAFYNLSQHSIIVLIILLLTLILSVILIKKILTIITKNHTVIKLDKFNYSMVNKAVLLLLILFTLFPILKVLFIQLKSLDFNLNNLFPTLLLTFIASIVSCTVAILFAIFSRLAWYKILNSFNTKSMLFIMMIFSFILIPPIVTLVLTFKWMQIIGYSSSNTIYLSWICGHIFLGFPLLATFSIITHFKVKNSYIDYANSSKLNLFEKITDLFLKPFSGDYILLFILSYATIWNDSTINNVLSDVIPSFATELNKTITGKSADYANGMNYLLISILLGVLSVITWNVLVKQQQNKLR